MAMTQEQLMAIVEAVVQQRLAAAGIGGGTNDRAGGFGHRRNQEDFRRVDKFSGGDNKTACRRSFETEAADDPKVRRAIEKQNEFLAKTLEEDERRKRPRLADDHESKLLPATPVTCGGSSGSGLTDACRIPTEPSAETSWGGAKGVVSWADAQESDEEMVGTDETSKRQKVQVIEAALQVVNEECTEFTGGGEEVDPVKLFAGRKDEEEFMGKSAGARWAKPRRPQDGLT